jgi:hypothetical protein
MVLEPASSVEGVGPAIPAIQQVLLLLAVHHLEGGCAAGVVAALHPGERRAAAVAQ